MPVEVERAHDINEEMAAQHSDEQNSCADECLYLPLVQLDSGQNKINNEEHRNAISKVRDLPEEPPSNKNIPGDIE